MPLDEKTKQSILDAGHKVVLDGSATSKDLITPFDAHDQVLRESPAGEPQEFPKAVAHHKETGEPLVANDADHETELLDTLDTEKYA